MIRATRTLGAVSCAVDDQPFAAASGARLAGEEAVGVVPSWTTLSSAAPAFGAATRRQAVVVSPGVV
jgi:hypothetical protein